MLGWVGGSPLACCTHEKKVLRRSVAQKSGCGVQLLEVERGFSL